MIFTSPHLPLSLVRRGDRGEVINNIREGLRFYLRKYLLRLVLSKLIFINIQDYFCRIPG
jgi:hypothetical protein